MADITSKESPSLLSQLALPPVRAHARSRQPVREGPTEMHRARIGQGRSVPGVPVDIRRPRRFDHLDNLPLFCTPGHSNGGTGASAPSNQTIRTFCASSPWSEFNAPTSWLTCAASRGSSSQSTSSHPRSCLKSRRPLELGDQITIWRSTSDAGGCNSGVSLAASCSIGKASGQLPVDVKLDGWPAQTRNRSPAASKQATPGVRPARQPRGDVATIPGHPTTVASRRQIHRPLF